MATLADWLYRLLDWLIDDRWANHNTVLEAGLVIRGEWETGRLFVHGEELQSAGWEDREKPWGQLRNPTRKFRWGGDSSERREAARAILEWFLDENELAMYLENFTTEVVAEFPESDFELTFNFVGWRNRNNAVWRWE